MYTRALLFCGFFGCPVSDQLNTEHQTFAPNFTYQIVLLRKFAEPVDEVISDIERVLLQLFPIDHFEYGPALCAYDRISAERIEMDSFSQTLCDLGSGYHCAKGSAVSDPFSQGYDVWYYTLTFESPIGLAGTAKTSLDFVRYADATCFTHMLVYMPKITIREHNGSANPLN